MLIRFWKKKMVEEKEIDHPEYFTCDKCRNLVKWNIDLKCDCSEIKEVEEE